MLKLFFNIIKFLPIGMAVVCLNFLVDPAQLFHSGYIDQAADIVLDGHNVVGMGNYDERLFNKKILSKETDAKDTLILGSSRVMELSDDSISDLGSYRNLGVSGAGVYDYLGLLGIYEEKHGLPDKVIIGADPWILNVNNDDERYKSILEDAELELKRIVGDEARENKDSKYNLINYIKTSDNVQKMTQIVSLSYFQQAVKYLFQNRNDLASVFQNEIDYYETDNDQVDGAVRYADGSTDYPAKYNGRTEEAIDIQVKNSLTGQMYQIENYRALDDGLEGIFFSFTEYLLDNGVEVVFYLPPYHPFVYDYICSDKKYRCVLEAEHYFRSLATEKGITVYGSYDAKGLGVTKGCFLDGLHLRRADIGKAWRQLCP